MLTYRPMPGVRSTERRGIGFLEGHPELDAGSEFDALPEKVLRQLFAFVDQWLGCSPDIPTRFHGYRSGPKYRDCYVFKPRGKRKESRFYGYLCHPQPKTRQRFELCVLCIHALKNERETDDAELDRVLDWLCSNGARMAIAIEFPDGGGGSTQ
jgi:hypothetical protein